jgi:hypothetical protein
LGGGIECLLKIRQRLTNATGSRSATKVSGNDDLL